MNESYLLTGGNIGDSHATLMTAMHQIERRCGPVTQQSSLYQTAAWGVREQPPFLNQVLKISTELDADALLQVVLQIEESLGRERTVKYGPRTIDIDILFYSDAIINEPLLTVPHPQLQHRRFVLEPLAEIAPQLIHPVLKKTITQLLVECTDRLHVQKIS